MGGILPLDRSQTSFPTQKLLRLKNLFIYLFYFLLSMLFFFFFVHLFYYFIIIIFLFFIFFIFIFFNLFNNTRLEKVI